MDITDELVDQELRIKVLEDQVKNICKAVDELEVVHNHICKALKVLSKDYCMRNNPDVDDIVRGMYG